MASIVPRRNKAGEILSYQVKWKDGGARSDRWQQAGGHFLVELDQELPELLRAVPAVQGADHFAGCDFQRGEQCGGTGADVVVGSPLGNSSLTQKTRACIGSGSRTARRRFKSRWVIASSAVLDRDQHCLDVAEPQRDGRTA